MKWNTAVQRRLLGDAGAEQVKKFLLANIPRFRAPTAAASWRRQIPCLQRDALGKVYLRGYPMAAVRGKPRVVWGSTLRPHRSYTIRKLRYEAQANYWIPALLYEPTGVTEPVPIVLNPNGHHPGGKAAEYKQARCINLAKRGMIALSFEFIGMGELESDARHNEFAYLDWTGQAGVGLHYLAMKKGLDVLLNHPHADASRVAMTGLSGGAWQTIILSALDPRITVSVPVAGYTSVRARVGCLEDIGDLEQTPPDMLTVADYDTMTAMLAPRPTLLILNAEDDCCFRTDRAKPIIFDAVRPTFRAMKAAARFQTYNNTDPGTHNYEADNRSQLYRFLNRHFMLDSPEADLPYEAELYTEPELNIGLPSSHKSVVALAMKRVTKFETQRRLPRTARGRRDLRHRLTAVLRLPTYRASGPRLAKDARVANIVVRTGPWKLPASIRRDVASDRTTLVIADGGRQACADSGTAPSRSGSTVVVDILGTGENRSDPQHLMIIDCTGQRLLGIRVAQLLACRRYIKRVMGAAKVELHADGRNCSLTALLAAALEPGAFCGLTLNRLPGKLRRFIEWQLPFEDVVTSMCFGLLEVADIPDVLALLEDVPVRQPDRAVPPM